GRPRGRPPAAPARPRRAGRPTRRAAAPPRTTGPTRRAGGLSFLGLRERASRVRAAARAGDAHVLAHRGRLVSLRPVLVRHDLHRLLDWDVLVAALQFGLVLLVLGL